LFDIARCSQITILPIGNAINDPIWQMIDVFKKMRLQLLIIADFPQEWKVSLKRLMFLEE
jgi:hypothetical protein